MALPSLHRTLRACAQFYGLDPARIEALSTRPGTDADLAPALHLYCWAADIMTTHNRLAIGIYVGMDAATVAKSIAAVEAERGANPDLTDRHDELLLEIHAEAEALAQLHITEAPEDDPYIIAARLNGPARGAYGVPLTELRVLARSFVGIAAELRAAAAQVERLTAAMPEQRRRVSAAASAPQPANPSAISAAKAAVARALYTPGERHARQALARLQQEKTHVQA